MSIKHLQIIAPEMNNTRVDSKSMTVSSAAWEIGKEKLTDLIGVPVSFFRNSSKKSVANGVITELLASPEHGANRYIIKASYTGRDTKWMGEKSNGAALVYGYEHELGL